MAGRWRIMAVAALFVPVAACAQGSGGFDPSATLQIESPSEGARVSVPFTVELSSALPLGQAGEGNYVQVYVNGLKGPRVNSESFEITQGDLPGPASGTTAIHVSVFNSEGTPVIAEDEVRVMLAGGGGS